MTLPSVRTWASTGSILSALNELGAFGKAIARRVKRSPNFPTCRRSAKWLSRSVFMGGLRGPEGNTSRFVDRFAAEVNKVLASDEVKNRLLELGVLPGVVARQRTRRAFSDRNSPNGKKWLKSPERRWSERAHEQ